MPNFDGTGPEGKGPTGMKRGSCGAKAVQKDTTPSEIKENVGRGRRCGGRRSGCGSKKTGGSTCV